MKKSKIVTLALITAALASCHKEDKRLDDGWKPEKKVYMRSDTSANYSQTHFNMNNWFLWYYCFRPYGYYNGGSYMRSGFYSSGISQHSNIGHSASKSGIIRGGFGGHGFAVSS